MSAPVLLDLYCGAGGSARGYQDAGFDVVGVDIVSQPHYPYAFLRADAIDVLDDLLAGIVVGFHSAAGYRALRLRDVDAIHASPPCQAFSKMTARHGAERVASHPDLIEPTRSRLKLTGRPYAIENVTRAPLDGVVLCGTMFGLGAAGRDLIRHRRFESNVDLWPPATCAHVRPALAVYGHAGGRSKRDGIAFTGVDGWREGMGIDWMTGAELAEAIPPAYTLWVGAALLQTIGAESSGKSTVREPTSALGQDDWAVPPRSAEVA